MLSQTVWLRSSAQDLLRSTSTLLKGEVPCPVSKLVQALEDVGSAPQCEGLLADADIRAAFAKKLKGNDAPKEVSNASAAWLVDALASTLKEKLDAIKAKAKGLAQKLKKDIPHLPELEKTLGVPLGEAVKRDWVQWHAPGSAHDSKLLPGLAPAVLKERISLLAACGQDGPVTQSAVSLHVLENLEAYLAWELLIPGSKTPPTGKAVLTPFDKNLIQQVAIRRVLSRVLPMDVATSAAGEASDAKSLCKSLEAMTAAARKSTVIPLYCPPAEPKAPKEKGEKSAKGEKSEKGEKGEKKKVEKTDGSSGSAATAPLKVASGELKKYREATATQELQYHLLRYRMTPCTTLGAATPTAPGAASAAPQNIPSQANGAPAAESGGGGKPGGFAGIWAPGELLPPGHTPFSWQHAKAEGMGQGFATTWGDAFGVAPPGHTEHSWKKHAAYGSASPSASSGKKAAASKAPKTAAAPQAKTDETKAAAKPGKAPVASPAGAPAEGSPEAALCKLDIRCGRILKVEKVPDSDKLYLLQVNIGDEPPRQVVSGLQKHYKEADLQNRAVVVYCNIKPGKLAGCESQAMILAASKDKGSDKEVCELLEPPAGVAEGTRPQVGALEVGSASAGVSVKNISKVWGVVQPLLLASDKKEAVFSGTPLLMGGKPVKTGSVADGTIS